jgi:protein TonB
MKKIFGLIISTLFLLTYGNAQDNKNSDSASRRSDSVTAGPEKKVFTKIERQAEFTGGVGAWQKFLEKALDMNVGADNGARPGKYTVIVRFLVSTDGTVTDIVPLTKHGYGMEQEVIRVIKLSGKWNPAIQNREPVKAYRRQPVTFIISD